MKTKKVCVWHDDDPQNSGWVARCTEYEDGRTILGRVAMDEALNAGDRNAARVEAANH